MKNNWVERLNMRIIFAGIFLALGIGLAILTFCKGMPAVALALALAGVYTGLGIFLGITDSLQNPIFQYLAAIIGAIGILSVFLYSNFFNIKLQSAYTDALITVGAMDTSCRPMKSELLDIQKFAIAACSTQGNSDQIGVVVEFGKGLHFGPTLTLVDSSVALSNGEVPNYCAKAFLAANQLCPAAFTSMSEASRNALIKAAH